MVKYLGLLLIFLSSITHSADKVKAKYPSLAPKTEWAVNENTYVKTTICPEWLLVTASIGTQFNDQGKIVNVTTEYFKNFPKTTWYAVTSNPLIEKMSSIVKDDATTFYEQDIELAQQIAAGHYDDHLSVIECIFRDSIAHTDIHGNVRYSGYTLAHYAAQLGLLKTLQALLAKDPGYAGIKSKYIQTVRNNQFEAIEEEIDYQLPIETFISVVSTKPYRYSYKRHLEILCTLLSLCNDQATIENLLVDIKACICNREAEYTGESKVDADNLNYLYKVRDTLQNRIAQLII
ncbi:hypothetical protein KG892_00685 [Vermiphilus pyriformis]|nr:MAG: hypothetical protein KG892_00685 [Vermiphilus pyriformis]